MKVTERNPAMGRTWSLIATAVLSMTLVACGGNDNNDNPSTGTDQSSSSGGTTASSSGGASSSGSSSGSSSSSSSGGQVVTTLTPRYERLPDVSAANDMLAQMNAQGARGFRYLSAWGGTTDPIGNIYVSDIQTTYVYELLPVMSSSADFAAQLNSQGARGFKYEGTLGTGNQLAEAYSKDNSSQARYSYELLAAPSSAQALQAQLNSQGNRGFRYAGTLVQGYLYMRDTTRNDNFNYELSVLATTWDAFLAKSNEAGARGFRYKGPEIVGSDSVDVYMKDASQTANFVYQSFTYDVLTDSGSKFVQDANTQGAQGWAYLDDMYLSGFYRVYFKASQCTGFMCSTLEPRTQN